jgi:hypothetical protein
MILFNWKILILSAFVSLNTTKYLVKLLLNVTMSYSKEGSQENSQMKVWKQSIRTPTIGNHSFWVPGRKWVLGIAEALERCQTHSGGGRH